MNSILRYWNTVRYLRPVQLYGRVWFNLARPRPDLSPAPNLRDGIGPWAAPAVREVSLLGRRSFRFFGQSGDVDEVGWCGPHREKLWRYNQHYFDDLNSRDSHLRYQWHFDLLKDWVSANPPSNGDGWEPYPTSLRIVNWVKFAWSGRKLPPECIQSLAVQARWLSQRLEVHLSGNHLLANAKALLFAGLFFDGAEASRWLELGFHFLRAEFSEQVLPDGGHYELSPMYHALVFEDVLDICNALRRCFQSLTPPLIEFHCYVLKLAPTMLFWLHTMCHPDGDISFFNDSAFGVAPWRTELERYAASLGIKTPDAVCESRYLESSGYVRLKAANAVVLLDVAAVGPDHLPGHAHADTLSFELSVDAQRVIVNSGTSCYGLGTERLRQRGTAAHNTVIFQGLDSSEVWGSFRVARRARVKNAQVNLATGIVQADHDGYMRVRGGAIHRRRWALVAGELVIEDLIAGGTAEAYFHFHPSISLQLDPHGRSGSVTSPVVCLEWHLEQGVASVQKSTWHPSFGACIPNSRLRVHLEGGRSRISFRWRSKSS